MKILGNFMKWFLYITVGIMIVCGISYKMAGFETITVDIFWMILVSAFLSSGVTVLLLPKEEDGKTKTCVKFGLHYISLCIIMCYLGARFGWIYCDMAGIVGMVIRVGFVYLLTVMAYYLIDVKQADEINKVLQEKYGDEEA